MSNALRELIMGDSRRYKTLERGLILFFFRLFIYSGGEITAGVGKEQRQRETASSGP